MIVDPSQTRGYRNNNPFNIEESGIPWHGIAGHDGPFLRFDTPLNGLRAGFRNLRNAQVLHHRNTVAAIISVYAPKADNNDTDAYIARVAEHLGVKPDTYLNMRDACTLRSFGEACIIQEIGGLPYDEAALAEAVVLALGPAKGG